MKILLINTVPTDKNGITNVIFNYLRAIDTDAVKIDIVSINEPNALYLEEVEKKGVRLYVLPRLNGVVKYSKSLLKLIRENDYNAVHIHGNSHTTVLELVIAKIAGCSVRIVHAHNTSCKYVFLHKLLSPLFHLLCTHCLACGVDAGKFMYGKRSFTVINNGVDVERFSFKQNYRERIRERHNWYGCRVIGNVGSFSEVKNQQWILKVFRELIKIDDSYRLVLIGDGELREAISNKAKEYGFENNVTLTGNINNVDEYLNAIDLILMPSLYEGLPLTLIEQQVNGLKSLVSDNISSEANLTNNLTFLSLSSNEIDWAETIIHIMMKSDKGRMQMSNEAVDIITKYGYNIKLEAKKLLNYYLQTNNS